MDLNRKNLKKLIFLISFGVILFLTIQNLSVVFEGIQKIISIFLPLIIGFTLAFILNVPMKFLEEKLLGWFSRKNFKIWQKIRRPVCLLLTIAFIIGLILILLFIIVPGLQTSFNDFLAKLPAYLSNTQDWLDNTLQKINKSYSGLVDYKLDWDNINSSILKFAGNTSINFLNYGLGFTTSLVGWIYNLVLGLFLAIYMLLQKEKVCTQLKKLLFAYLPEDKAQWMVNLARTSNNTFFHFITGQLTEAVILGCLCFLSMTIFGFPYAPLISVIIAITALIPMIGAFIGVTFGTLLILMVKPIQALYFIIFFVILQQFEGNVIYPRVVGNSVGLNGLWVLAAITVGAGLFGVVGILLSVPTCSVLYGLLKHSVLDRLQIKKIPPEKYR